MGTIVVQVVGKSRKIERFLDDGTVYYDIKYGLQGRKITTDAPFCPRIGRPLKKGIEFFMWIMILIGKLLSYTSLPRRTSMEFGITGSWI